MEWIALLVVIVILGALAGGKTFGETVSNGCGCLVVIVLALALAVGAYTGTSCMSCGATGKCGSCEGSGRTFLIVTCAACGGSGQCATCHGSGKGWLTR